MDVISKLILNSLVVNGLNCNSASGVLKGHLTFVDYMDV